MRNDYGEAVDPVGFGEAISICFKKYFVFQGRAKLSEYWYFILFCIILSLIGIYLSSIGSTPLSILGLILSYGTVIPQISVNVRRLHDTNRSGWYLWIPIYNLIITMFFDSSSEVSTSKSNINRSSGSKVTIKNDLTDELEELQELYEDGTLSEEQFKKAKNKLLK
tara:strand:- start:229 stop:726 length:498 start_codon:yes stop_codon:yes gene_type:complete